MHFIVPMCLAIVAISGVKAVCWSSWWSPDQERIGWVDNVENKVCQIMWGNVSCCRACILQSICHESKSTTPLSNPSGWHFLPPKNYLPTLSATCPPRPTARLLTVPRDMGLRLLSAMFQHLPLISVPRVPTCITCAFRCFRAFKAGPAPPWSMRMGKICCKLWFGKPTPDRYPQGGHASGLASFTTAAGKLLAPWQSNYPTFSPMPHSVKLYISCAPHLQNSSATAEQLLYTALGCLQLEPDLTSRDNQI